VTGLMVFADSLVHGHPPSGLKRLPDYDTPRRRGKEAVLFALTVKPLDMLTSTCISFFL